MITDAGVLLAEAARRAGADAWPDDDSAFLPTLEVLLESCGQRANMNDVGADVLHRVVVRHLRNRLVLRAYVDAHPDTAHRPLDVAVIITGLPRTGTTLLHNLMALDPARRVLRFWEALHPLPPPDDAARGRLVENAARWLDRFYAMVPEFRTIHPVTPEGPEECDTLLQNSFVSQHFEDMFDTPAYSDWLLSADLTDAYWHYALQLRVLAPDDGRPGPWVLKSPGHLAHLPELARVVRGSAVVWCHRRPLDAVASHASLVATLRRAYATRVDPTEVGAQCLQRAAATIRMATAARAAMPARTFVDVNFDDLVIDPIAVVERLYGDLDHPLSAAARAAMIDWLAANPRRPGLHRYDAEEFGLTASAVDQAFGDYSGAPTGRTPPRH